MDEVAGHEFVEFYDLDSNINDMNFPKKTKSSPISSSALLRIICKRFCYSLNVPLLSHIDNGRSE